MAPSASDSEPRPERAPDPQAEGKAAVPDGQSDAEPVVPDPESDPQPDPEKARRTSDGLLWGCAGLTVLVGLFQLSGILTSSEPFGAAAWLGVVVGALCLLAMTAAYVLCAMNRLHLRTRVLGRLDVFQVTTVLMVVAIAAGVLVPTRNTTTLALLLPWGLSYWLNNLERTSSP